MIKHTEHYNYFHDLTRSQMYTWWWGIVLCNYSIRFDWESPRYNVCKVWGEQLFLKGGWMEWRLVILHHHSLLTLWHKVGSCLSWALVKMLCLCQHLLSPVHMVEVKLMLCRDNQTYFLFVFVREGIIQEVYMVYKHELWMWMWNNWCREEMTCCLYQFPPNILMNNFWEIALMHDGTR